MFMIDIHVARHFDRVNQLHMFSCGLPWVRGS